MSAIVGVGVETRAEVYGTSVSIPNNNIARLMYYLKCVSGCLDDIIPSTYTNYNNYYNLTSLEKKEVVAHALLCSPELLLGKILIPLESSHPILEGHTNKFLKFTEVTTVVGVGANIDSTIIVGGKSVEVNKVMILTKEWLISYYIDPIKAEARILDTVEPPRSSYTAKNNSYSSQSSYSPSHNTSSIPLTRYTGEQPRSNRRRDERRYSTDSKCCCCTFHRKKARLLMFFLKLLLVGAIVALCFLSKLPSNSYTLVGLGFNMLSVVMGSSVIALELFQLIDVYRGARGCCTWCVHLMLVIPIAFTSVFLNELREVFRIVPNNIDQIKGLDTYLLVVLVSSITVLFLTVLDLLIGFLVLCGCCRSCIDFRNDDDEGYVRIE